ncbi:glycosyltransferase family 2 protein [Rhodococcus wratislaviensis]|uniref:Putative glycosyltransferase n=1 Tax=Rhodococcus wratislaviensis NBRC 100605 TaxID=1219028 RepID=X0Q3F0_RHOWR|nr:glycosyltransferase family A protein [Rhodococcus wratislaviensis]GAF50718.1 putative glycosyltransferase [Rhodococcus wratislaviensis NBRC 100605]
MRNVRSSPTFSILTTAYKTEPYVAQTIESVLRQTRTDWELIVVDNGYSDEMAQIVSSYAAQDTRIRLIRQENRGVGGGVVAAATRARGRFFCVLNSDDLLMPEFCERMGAVIDADPVVDAVGCDAQLFDDRTGDVIGTHQRSLGIKKRPVARHRLTLAEALAGRIPYYTGVVRREAWSAVGGYESDTATPEIEEDVILWLCLVDAGFDVRLLPDRLCRFRQRENSLSHDPLETEAFEQRLERSFTVVARASGRPGSLAAAAPTLRWLKYNQSLRRARWAFLDGDISAARTAAKAAFDHRHTARAALVVAALTLAPRTLRSLHPAKQRLTSALTRIAWRLNGADR